MPIPLIAGALAVFGAKKKSNREYAKWTEMFPVTDDCVAMDDIIKAAEERWKVEDREFNQTKKIKVQVRINQKRERDTLRDYINDMRNYRKDLVCGISATSAPVAPAPVVSQPAIVNPPMSQETVLVPATLVNTGNTNAPGRGLAFMPSQESMQQLKAPETESQTEKKPAVDAKLFLGLTKKQLIIGAVALAAVGGAVYFIRKN